MWGVSMKKTNLDQLRVAWKRYVNLRCSSGLQAKIEATKAAQAEETEHKMNQAWIVTRDSESDSPELFLTEEAARQNACLGVATTHIYPCVWGAVEGVMAQTFSAIENV